MIELDTCTRIAYQFKTLEDIEPLAYKLAACFSQPEEVYTAIHELLLNAVEHGNLELGFETKSALLRKGRWLEEVSLRQHMQPYANRYVSVLLERDHRRCIVSITDQGQGFDWQHYCTYDTALHTPHGRGLQIVMQSGFDQVVFNDAGNKVTCITRYA